MLMDDLKNGNDLNYKVFLNKLKIKHLKTKMK